MTPKFKIGDKIVLVKKPVFSHGDTTIYDRQYIRHIPTTILEIKEIPSGLSYAMSGPQMRLNSIEWIDAHCELCGSTEEIFYSI